MPKFSLKKMTLTQLDSKLCWKRWMSLGSLRFAANEFAKEGVVGRNTGKPHNHTAIEKAAFRWLSDPSVWDEAKDDFRRYCMEYWSYSPSEDDWNDFLFSSLNHYFVTKSKFKEWLIENNMTEKAKKHLDKIQLAKIGI